jgi:hypothetical protein
MRKNTGFYNFMIIIATVVSTGSLGLAQQQTDRVPKTFEIRTLNGINSLGIAIPPYVFEVKTPEYLYNWTSLQILRQKAEDSVATGNLPPMQPIRGSKIGQILGPWFGDDQVLFAGEDPVGGMGRDGAIYARPMKPGIDSDDWYAPRAVLGRDISKDKPAGFWANVRGAIKKPEEQKALDVNPQAVQARAIRREVEFQSNARSAYLLTMRPRRAARIGVVVSLHTTVLDLTDYKSKFPPGVITDPNDMGKADLIYHLNFESPFADLSKASLAYQEWIVRNPLAIEAISARPEAARAQIEASLREIDASPTHELSASKKVFPRAFLPEHFRDLLEDYLELGGRDLPAVYDRTLARSRARTCGGLFLAD